MDRIYKLTVLKFFTFVIMSFLIEGCSVKEEVKDTSTLPVVSTNEVSEITRYSAVSGGDVTSDGGSDVKRRGICWSKNENPTILDGNTKEGEGIGEFSSKMEGLSANTTYYVRAYAVNSVGTGYGAMISFTTEKEPVIPVKPEVKTTEITNITQNSAVLGGEVVGDGNAVVTSRGVCWNTTGSPTIEDNITEDGNGIGVFTSKITNLVSGYTYYVRAYAINSVGVSYGEELTFTTQKSGINIEDMPNDIW